VFTLEDYVDADIMSGAQAELLRAAVLERKNILVAGGTSTGKTTHIEAVEGRAWATTRGIAVPFGSSTKPRRIPSKINTPGR
jgi:Flp pilus assembly CpaF family ATPase